MIGTMSLEEFADEVKARRGRLSQAELARLAGINVRTIERLESLRAAAPFTTRKQAIAIALALNWEPNEALACLGYEALSARERARIGSTTVDDKLDRFWPQLTGAQKEALVNLMATMVVPHAHPPTKPNGKQNNLGFEIPPDDPEEEV